MFLLKDVAWLLDEPMKYFVSCGYCHWKENYY